MEWTKAMTLKLIELWQTKPCLWQVKSPEYKNKNKKRQALAELSDEMEIPASAIEKRFVSLKTQYSRALYRNKTKSDMGFDDDSGWYAFDHLHFLREGPLQHNTLKSDMSDSTNDMIDDSKEHIKISCSPEHVESADPTDDASMILVAPVTHDTTTHDSWHESPPHKRARGERREGSCLKPNKFFETAKDEYSAFGDLVAAELRSEPDERNRLLLRKEITDVIYNFKLNSLSNTN